MFFTKSVIHTGIGLSVFIVTLLNSVRLSAATYYCGPSGDDNRTAQQAQDIKTPFRFLERAIEVVADGDTIVALDGVYDALRVRNPSYRSFGQVFFPNSKSMTAKSVTIRALNKWGATCRGQVAFAGLEGIRFEGFRLVSAFNLPEGRGVCGIDVYGCSNPTIRDCYILSENQAGIYFADCDWIQAEWNIISYSKTATRSNPFVGIAIFQPRYQSGPVRNFGIWLRNNTIFNTLNGFLLKVDNTLTDIPASDYNRPVMIENNFVFDLNALDAPANADKSSFIFESVQNVRVRNNTLVRDFGFDDIPMVSIRESDRIYVYNNIIAASNETPAIELTGNTEALVFANVVEGTEIPAEVEMMNYIGSPEFDPGTLIPSAHSPAVNNAFDAGDHFFLDVFGGPRYIGPLDIGAIER